MAAREHTPNLALHAWALWKLQGELMAAQASARVARPARESLPGLPVGEKARKRPVYQLDDIRAGC